MITAEEFKTYLFNVDAYHTYLMDIATIYLLKIFENETDPEAAEEVFQFLRGGRVVDKMGGSISREIGSVYVNRKQGKPELSVATPDFTYVINNANHSDYILAIHHEKIPFVDTMKSCFASEGTSLAKSLSPREVYETNKTRAKCIVCGKPTEERMLFTSSIQYCPCMENK